MEKWPVILGLFLVFILGIGVGAVYFGSGLMTSDWDRAYALSDIKGSQVKNMQGEDLGTLDDFVIDTDGRVGFAILSHADKLVAVPFDAITYDQSEKRLSLNMSKERIESAPAFDKSTDLSRSAWTDEIFRYYGVQPYWGEERLGQRQSMPGMMEEPHTSR
jgi:sporulation protein YlmC with PRC-barrel domain